MYERVWKVRCKHNGFTYFIFIRTTEMKLNDYINSEVPEAVGFSGATDGEVKAAQSLATPIYCY